MFFYQSDVQYLCDFNILYLFVNILPIILGNKVFVEINEFKKRKKTLAGLWFLLIVCPLKDILQLHVRIIYISLAKISKKV